MRKVPARVVVHPEQPLVAQRGAQLGPLGVAQLRGFGLPHLLHERRLHALFEDGPVRDEVGVGARVGLHIGVVCAEELAGQVGREALDGVDVVASGVEAVVRDALGVLVGEQVALGELHGQRGVVLAGDHLQARPLVCELGHDGGGDLRGDARDLLQRRQVGREARVGRRAVLGALGQVLCQG